MLIALMRISKASRPGIGGHGNWVILLEQCHQETGLVGA
jgi:hypothetical protein